MVVLIQFESVSEVLVDRVHKKERHAQPRRPGCLPTTIKSTLSQMRAGHREIEPTD